MKVVVCLTQHHSSPTHFVIRDPWAWPGATVCSSSADQEEAAGLSGSSPSAGANAPKLFAETTATHEKARVISYFRVPSVSAETPTSRRIVAGSFARSSQLASRSSNGRDSITIDLLETAELPLSILRTLPESKNRAWRSVRSIGEESAS